MEKSYSDTINEGGAAAFLSATTVNRLYFLIFLIIGTTSVDPLTDRHTEVLFTQERFIDY
jgi:hypothetical protein